MNYTTNYGLNKPESVDQYNINHWNENSDILDTALHNEVVRATQAHSEISSALSDEVTARQSDCNNARDLANATGVLSVAKGGTGETTKTGAINNLLSDVQNAQMNNADLVLFQKIISGENGDTKNLSNIALSDFADKLYLLLEGRIQTTVPIGVIYPFAGEFGTDPTDPDHKYDLVPHGYLACDGREVSRTTYSALFAKIGTKYGNGDEINTFNLPDFRECVLIGAGKSTRADIASHDIYTLGQFKDDQFQGHEHNYLYRQFEDRKANPSSGTYIARNETTGKTTAIVTDNTNGTPRVGSTTHGKQIGVNYIIKY